jgi:hypothetical protein
MKRKRSKRNIGINPEKNTEEALREENNRKQKNTKRKRSRHHKVEKEPRLKNQHKVGNHHKVEIISTTPPNAKAKIPRDLDQSPISLRKNLSNPLTFPLRRWRT